MVLTIGTEKITRAQWEGLVTALPEPVQQQASTPQGRRQLAEQLAELKAVAHEARRQKYDEDPKMKAILSIQGDQALASGFIRHKSESATVDEKTLREAYEAEKMQHRQVDARHILIRFKGSPIPTKPDQKDLTEEEALVKAQAIKKRLEANEDFAALAKAESDDSGSGAQGGELGMFGPGQMVKPFEEAAFNLTPGRVSEPVKSQFGYHVIQVKSQVTKTFEEVRPRIEAKKRPEITRKFAEEIRKGANITFDEKYFEKAQPSAPLPPPAPGAPPVPAPK